jgi:VIT1/CCC1 family predicted Fe2+/Mn2+ transporter
MSSSSTVTTKPRQAQYGSRPLPAQKPQGRIAPLSGDHDARVKQVFSDGSVQQPGQTITPMRRYAPLPTSTRTVSEPLPGSPDAEELPDVAPSKSPVLSSSGTSSRRQVRDTEPKFGPTKGASDKVTRVAQSKTQAKPPLRRADSVQDSRERWCHTREELRGKLIATTKELEAQKKEIARLQKELTESIRDLEGKRAELEAALSKLRAQKEKETDSQKLDKILAKMDQHTDAIGRIEQHVQMERRDLQQIKETEKRVLAEAHHVVELEIENMEEHHLEKEVQEKDQARQELNDAIAEILSKRGERFRAAAEIFGLCTLVLAVCAAAPPLAPFALGLGIGAAASGAVGGLSTVAARGSDGLAARSRNQIMPEPPEATPGLKDLKVQVHAAHKASKEAHAKVDAHHAHHAHHAHATAQAVTP